MGELMTITDRSRPSQAPFCVPPSPIADRTLGDYFNGQLDRICSAVGVSDSDGLFHTGIEDFLGHASERLLAAGPASSSFISDDHSPVEFSLAFPTGTAPRLRVLVEPGSTGRSLMESGQTGIEALTRLADRWNFSTAPVDAVRDLFIPASPSGAFALWCAIEFRDSGKHAVKAYLNPGAQGPARSASIIKEALERFGYEPAWPRLRDFAAPRQENGKDEFLFFAVDLGDWERPRVKVYVRHHGASATFAAQVSRLTPGVDSGKVADFCREIGETERFPGRALISCFSFTEDAADIPTGHTIHVPVRGYATDDQVVRDRLVRILRAHAMDADLLDRSLQALTERSLDQGGGLISYVSLVQGVEAPRLTAYLSSEAYREHYLRTIQT